MYRYHLSMGFRPLDGKDIGKDTTKDAGEVKLRVKLPIHFKTWLELALESCIIGFHLR